MVLETRELQFKNLVTPGDHFNDSATLSLLPPSDQAEKSSTNLRPKNQLTIFYAGSVNVYDDIPEDKAHAIMLLAGNAVAGGNMNQLVSSLACFEQQPQPSAPQTSSPTALPPFLEPPLKARKLQAVSTPAAQSNLHLSLNSHVLRPNGSAAFSNVGCSGVPLQALPQARKASLTRFLQRRKERFLQENAKQENSNITTNTDLKQDSPATQDGAKSVEVS